MGGHLAGLFKEKMMVKESELTEANPFCRVNGMFRSFLGISTTQKPLTPTGRSMFNMVTGPIYILCANNG